MNLHDWMPPRITRIVQKRRRGPTYDSFQSAMTRCGTGYDDDEIAAVVVAKTEIACEELQHDPVFDAASIAVAVGIGVAVAGERLRVLDIGGAAGLHYFQVRQLRAQPLEWRVVETPAMVRAAARLASTELTFHDDLDTATENGSWRPDLLFASGVLQSMSDPLSALKRWTEVDAPVIHLTRTALTEGTEREIYVQRSSLATNGPGVLPPGMADAEVRYPLTLERRGDVEAILAARYTISARIIEGADKFGYIGRRR